MSRSFASHSSNFTFVLALAMTVGCSGQAPKDTCNGSSVGSTQVSDPCSGSGGSTTAGGGSSGGNTSIGGSSGSSSLPPLDLTCHSDDDCCVATDTCLAIAVLYSKIGSPANMPPTSYASCSKCWTPVVEVSCVNNQCVGVDKNMSMNGTSHCGKLATGTGGAGSVGLLSIAIPSSSTTAASPAAATATTTQSPTFGCGG
jgi:hypothetical protein